PLGSFNFNAPGATFAAAGRTFTVDGVSNVAAGNVTWNASAWTGDATSSLTNSGAMTVLGASSVSTASFIQNGSLDIEATSTVHGTLTANSSFTNNGTITLDQTGAASTENATLSVTAGNVLTNSAAGVISVSDDTSDAAVDRFIVANLVNDGTININENTSFSLSSSVLTNNGDFNVATGRTFSITAAGGVFTQAGGTLDIDGALTMSADTFNFDGGALSGNDPILTSSALSIGPLSTGAGSFRMRSTGGTLSGDIAAAQTVRVEATSTAHSTVTSSSSYTNNGTIILEQTGAASTENATLNVTAGSTLTNGATGVITTVNDTSDAAVDRYIVANLTNNGVVNIDENTSFALANSVLTNNADFNIAPSQTFSVTAASGVFTQDGGTLDVDGSFTMSADTFNFNGGALSGNAPILTSSALSIGPSSTGAGTFRMRNTGGTLSGNIAPAQTVRLEATSTLHSTVTSAASFTNNGNIVLEQTGAASSENVTLNVTAGNTLTNSASGVITVVDDGSDAAVDRIITANIVNDGVINIDEKTSFALANSVMTNNANFNIATGQTFSITAASGVFTQDAGTLSVVGALTMSADTFNFNGGGLTGNAPILTSSALNIGASSLGAGTFRMRNTGGTLSGDIAPLQTVRIEATSILNSTLTSSSDYTNNGTIILEQSGAASTENATLNVTAGATLTNSNSGVITVADDTSDAAIDRTITANITNNGTININERTSFALANSLLTNNSDFNVATGQTFAVLAAGGVFTQAAGTLDIDGAFTMSVDTFNFNGGALSGNAPVLTSSALNIGPSSTGAGVFRMQNTGGTLSGDIAPAQTVRIEATSTLHSTVTSTASYTNNGAIILEQTGAASTENATLNVSATSTLTNSATGVITVADDASDAATDRVITANLTNNGTININENTLFSMANSEVINNANFDVATARTFAVLAAGGVFTQDGGTLNIAGALTMSADTFNFNGGGLTGNAPILTSSALNIGPSSTGAGEFRMRSTGGTLSGDIAAAQTVRVEATSTLHSTVTSSSSFTNNGELILEQSGAASTENATLNVTAGNTLTNGPTGVITIANDASDGGVDENMSFALASSALTNNANLNIATGQSLFLNGVNNVIKQAAGVFDIAGTLTMSADDLNFTGGSITGGGTVNLNTGSEMFGTGDADVVINNNSSRVSPGAASAATGILNVGVDAGATTGGDYAHNATGILDIEIGGPTPGVGFDQLNVEDNAELTGTLNIDFINGYVPNACDTFTIVTHATRTGATPTVNVTGLPAGMTSRVDFNAGDVTVVALNTVASINVSPASVNVAEGGAAAVYNVCLASSTAPTGVVTVTPSAGGEVVVAPASLTFDPATSDWRQVKQFTVTAVDDSDVEGDHTDTISHTSASSDPTFDGIAIDDVTANIADNDTAVVAFAASSSSATESGGVHDIDVVLSIPGGGVLASAVSVTVADLLTGSAGDPSDYSLAATSINFPAGSADGAIASAQLTTVQDDRVEGSETVDLELQSLVGPDTVSLATPTAHQATIVDDDFATISFAAATSSVAEPTPGHTVDVTLTINSSPSGGSLDRVVSVDVADLLSGSANDPADYSFSAPTITFNPGAVGSTQSVAMTIANDLLVEGDETVDLAIQNLADATGGQVSVVAPNTHVVTILDDDLPTVSFQAANSSAGESGGTHTITVLLSSPTGATLTQPLSVDVVDAGGGSAATPDDYVFATQTVTFPIGAGDGATATVNVTIADDSLLELDETTFLQLTNLLGIGAIIAPSDHELTILDDDTAVVRFATPADATAEAAGVHTEIVELSLTGTTAAPAALAVPISADVTDAGGGSATSGDDY
ncbi:MAG: Calx-beta domain-containing protein, partial [Pirellulaceae bacterium]|nr:Calx-beta domain-containing protein [Pirellulaceae bacterium]